MLQVLFIRCDGVWRLGEGTGCLCDRVLRPSCRLVPIEDYGALGCGWLLQWFVFAKAPLSHLRRFYLHINFHNFQLATEHDTGAIKSTLLIFERRLKWQTSIKLVLCRPQFVEFNVRCFMTVKIISMFLNGLF